MLAQPLLVSYSSPEQYLSVLPDDCPPKYKEDIKRLLDKELPPVVSRRCLGVLFGLTSNFIGAMCNSSDRYYREFTIRTGSKERKIQAPKIALKVIQRWFGYHLAKALSAEDYIFGFVPSRSHVLAARKHCGARWVYSVDIKDFFLTTDKDTVEKALLKLGYPKHGCKIITDLCFFRNGLAQGAPSSPVLSNLAMQEVDKELFALSQEHGIVFTRYADDIVFSGSSEFPDEIKDRVKDIFEPTCWKLSANKEHLADMQKGQRLKVHGLLVNKTVRLTKGYRNRLRAYKHMLNCNKVKKDDLQRLKGHVRYAESVDKLI